MQYAYMIHRRACLPAPSARDETTKPYNIHNLGG